MKLKYILIGGIILFFLSCKKEETKRTYGTIIEVPTEVTSIKEAIDIAEDYDTILLHPHEYFESNIIVKKPIYITSLYESIADSNIINQTIVNANKDSRVFYIKCNLTDSVRLNGFTIKNGKLTDNMTGNYTFPIGAGIYCSNSNLRICNMNIQNNSATDYQLQGAGGGGLYIENSTVHLSNTKINSNKGFQYGGAIYCLYSYFYCDNTIIENNLGINCMHFYKSNIYINNSIFRNNNPLGYPNIEFMSCNGILENIIVENDSISFENSTIKLIYCKLKKVNTYLK